MSGIVQDMRDALPHIEALPLGIEYRHRFPWTCSGCGKVGYALYPIEYGLYLPPAPPGWGRSAAFLGYGRSLFVTWCSEECRLRIEERYPRQFGPRPYESLWDKVRLFFGLSVEP